MRDQVGRIVASEHRVAQLHRAVCWQVGKVHQVLAGVVRALLALAAIDDEGAS